MTLRETKEKYRNGQLTKQDYIVSMHEFHKILCEYSDFIRTTDIRRIEISDGQVVTTSREHGVRMVCDPQDRRIAPFETLNFDQYEKQDCDMILRLVDDGQNVFDIGGNFGWYSLVIAGRKRVKVYAFEPVPRTFGYLKRNIELNGAENIEPFNFGFSDQEQDLNFFYYPEGSGNASIANLSEPANVQTVTCKVRRLDDFTRENGVRVDFIKCDVEGAELLVFRGGLQTIARDKPVVFAELLRKWSAKFGYHPNDVIDLFAREGYRCFTVSGDALSELRLVDDGTVETNFFFLHSVKHAEKIASIPTAGSAHR